MLSPNRPVSRRDISETFYIPPHLMDNKVVEAWIRTERRLLCVVGAALIAFVVYALHAGRVDPPIRGLGEPAFVARTKGAARVGYVLDRGYRQSLEDLDIRLQIKGFKRYYGAAQYVRGDSEVVTIYAGLMRLRSDGFMEYMNSDPNQTTIVYTVRTPTWWRPWRRLQRNWTAYQQAKANKAVATASGGWVVR